LFFYILLIPLVNQVVHLELYDWYPRAVSRPSLDMLVCSAFDKREFIHVCMFQCVTHAFDRSNVSR